MKACAPPSDSTSGHLRLAGGLASLRGAMHSPDSQRPSRLLYTALNLRRGAGQVARAS